MNHFDDFCTYVKGLDVSDTTKDTLIRRVSAAMLDAFRRGASDAVTTIQAPPVALGGNVAGLPNNGADTTDSIDASPSTVVDDSEAFAQRLSDAYATNRYRNGWGASIRALRSRGYTDQEIEAIIRSKWPRWASDRSGKPSGKVSAKDLLAYIDDPKNGCDKDAVADLVAGTFSH